MLNNCCTEDASDFKWICVNSWRTYLKHFLLQLFLKRMLSFTLFFFKKTNFSFIYLRLGWTSFWNFPKKNQFFLIIITQKQTSADTRIWDSVAHGTLVLLNKDRTSNARSSVGVQKQMLRCTSPPLLKPLPHQPRFCSTLCVLYFIICNFSISKREMIFWMFF
jgi:hypothetical protein